MKRSAFTLLEIVIVIIIIGVLAALALPKMANLIEGARAAEAISGISIIRSAMERCYLTNNGSYADCQLYLKEPSFINTLDIDDPGSSPGAHFGYSAQGSGAGKSYNICAYRRLDAPEEEYQFMYIVMGFGQEPVMIPSGVGVSIFIEHNDNKIYWDGAAIYKPFLPKKN